LYIHSTDSEATEQLAEKIGHRLRGGEVIELASDLGGGKTTFVRGLVRGAGSQDRVASPTFTISKVYSAPAFEIHHFDFYRLPEAGLIANELAEIIGDPRAVIVVEWARAVQHVLPSVRLKVHIEQTPDGSRRLTLQAPLPLQHLLTGIDGGL